MAQKLDIAQIWWRNVQPGEFYNIERYPQIAGGGGSLYIEIPRSLVERTLVFLDVDPARDVESLPKITIARRRGRRARGLRRPRVPAQGGRADARC